MKDSQGDIVRLEGAERWLSNFWLCQVPWQGSIYPSVENAYQRTKYNIIVGEDKFLRCTPGKAKRLGKEAKLSRHWDEAKVQIMYNLLLQKFVQGSFLAEKLLATGSCMITEGNHWGDTFWGVCDGEGENTLGMLLMDVRSGLNDYV